MHLNRTDACDYVSKQFISIRCIPFHLPFSCNRTLDRQNGVYRGIQSETKNSLLKNVEQFCQRHYGMLGVKLHLFL